MNAAERDEAAGPPEPRANPELQGHEAAERTLVEAWRSGRMPHAWLIEGPPGIGKATLAYRFARFVLAEGRRAATAGLFASEPAGLALAPDEQTFRLVAANSHPNLRILEREINEKTKRLYRDISVDQARKIPHFFHQTASITGYRIVIADPAEDMNWNAENALLKILEEPPPLALILLVSHAPGQLLPTIRSRCRRLQLRPLAPAILERLIRRYAPDLEGAVLEATLRLAQGSIGRALTLIEGGGIEFYNAVFQLVARVPGMDMKALHALADKAGRQGDQGEAVFETVTELYFGLLRRLTLIAGGADGGSEIVAGEGGVLARLAGRRGLDRWLELWDNSRRLVARTGSINLDRKQVILNIFLALEDERT